MAKATQKETLGSGPVSAPTTYFQPVTHAQAVAADRAEHAMLAVHATSNLVVLNDVPGPPLDG